MLNGGSKSVRTALVAFPVRPVRECSSSNPFLMEVTHVTNELNGKKIAFFTAPEGVEQVEMTTPWERLEAAGAQLELLSFQDGEVQMFNHLDKGDTR